MPTPNITRWLKSKEKWTPIHKSRREEQNILNQHVNFLKATNQRPYQKKQNFRTNNRFIPYYPSQKQQNYTPGNSINNDPINTFIFPPNSNHSTNCFANLPTNFKSALPNLTGNNTANNFPSPNSTSNPPSSTNLFQNLFKHTPTFVNPTIGDNNTNSPSELNKDKSINENPKNNTM